MLQGWAERQAKETALQAQETERQAKETALQAQKAERQAKEAALAEIERLKALLYDRDRPADAWKAVPRRSGLRPR